MQLAEQEIVKADAQAAVQTADDEVALLHARYDVRRAELDIQSNELVGAIKAQQNVLMLDEAKQRLAQLEADVEDASRDDQRVGRRSAREAQQGAAVGAGRRAQHREPAHPRAVRRLRHRAHEFQAFGGIYFRRMMPDYRVGDAAFAGQPIADVIDASRDRGHREAARAGSRERLAGPDGRSRGGRAARRDAARHGSQR